MISYDHSKATGPVVRGERGRGNSRKAAIGFRRRTIRIAHRSGNSSGRGDTATYSIYQPITRRGVVPEIVSVGRPQADRYANRMAVAVKLGEVVGYRRLQTFAASSSACKIGTGLSRSGRETRKTSAARLELVVGYHLFAEGGGENRPNNLMNDIEQNYAMTRDEYAEIIEFVEKNIPGGVIVEIRSGKVSQ